MNIPKPNKPKHKSRIASHAVNLNLLLLVFILTLLVAFSGVIINRINNENARNLVHSYSMEASQMFYSYIRDNLALAQKVAHSKALTNWYLNEDDINKKSIAFDEILDYAQILDNAHFYAVIDKSRNEYIIMGKAVLDDFIPFDGIDEKKPEDAWYVSCMESGNEYTLNFNIDKYTGSLSLWINYKVIINDHFAGVFCTGMRIPDIFIRMFRQYETNKVRGFIIDRYGAIQLDSITNGVRNVFDPDNINNESPDLEFTKLLDSYLGNITGIFNTYSGPEVIKLSRGPYNYASINTIEKTDWSVVIFYTPKRFSGITNLWPLMIVMLTALLLYVAVNTAIMRIVFFMPLSRLTQRVSEGKLSEYSSFDSNRDDEIGELAETIRDASRERQRLEKLMHAVNSTAILLLAPEDNSNFELSLMEGMETIGKCVEVDRIHLWRNELIDGELFYTNQFQWMNETGKKIKPAAKRRAYSEVPEWKKKFLNNEYVNGPVSAFTAQEKNIFLNQEVASVLAIPLYVQRDLYGYISFDDCKKERTFAEDEINILRSAGLMIISVIIRHSQSVQLRQAHEYNSLMLNATPMGCHIWDKNLNMVDCNDEAFRLFKLKNKQEYIKRFFELSPEYQSDGSLSYDLSISYMNKAINEGRLVFEWMHQTPDGTQIPAEITLVRIPYENDYVLAGYIRDMRDQKLMLMEIEQRDNLLHIGNSATAALLSTMKEEMFEVSIQDGMELIGNSIDVDRVNIWQNEDKDGVLHYTKKYEWANSIGHKISTLPIKTSIPYSQNPEWENTLSRGNCYNGPLYSLSEKNRDFFGKFGIKSLLMIPVHLHEQFWGFICFYDCHMERFFPEDEVSTLRSVAYMMVSALNQNMQAIQLRQAHERTQVLLDAMPLSCQLWNRDGKCFDCNKEALELFKVNGNQEFFERFGELSPEYQNDGQLSSKKAIDLLYKTFEEGKCVFEWTHRNTDGELLPSEVTLVRVNFGDEPVVAGYARDLRESKKMISEIEQRDHLLYTVNKAATILLQPETEKFESYLQYCMGIMADAVGVDRVTIWKNKILDGNLFCTQLYEWRDGSVSVEKNVSSENVQYSKIIPSWEGILSKGECIKGLVRDMPADEKAELASRDIQSIFVMPVFWRGKFWGFVGYDDCRKERIFSGNEQSILHSHGLLLVNALLRNENITDLNNAAMKLEAVVTNYTGIIWSVDRNFTITLYNGLLLEKLGRNSSQIVGRLLEDYMNQEQHSLMIEKIHKTFTDGPQDWISKIDGRILHSRSMPIIDENNVTTSVVGSFDDITEISRLQTDLEAALNEARKANLAKSDFLANMSHEMRTPLNAIIGLSELTLGNRELGGEVSSNCEKIYNAGLTLLSTVNDILDISKIEAGKFNIIDVEYDLPSLLNDTITQSILHKGEKPIEFILDIDEDLPSRLYGDDLRVKQVINNLLSNAFKYTREGKVELHVQCSRNGESVWLVIRVIDTGIGIRQEDLQNLFKDYTQLDKKFNRNIEGTGLGLSITKKIVEMMNGMITVDSEYGKGSVFTAKFRQKMINGAVIGKDIVDSLETFHYSDQKRMKNSQLERIRLPYAHILVVDDVVSNLDVAKGMLKPYGVHVDCVTSGKDAIEAIREEKVKYNAIFMDHMMPEMDGIEAAKIIREEIGTEYSKTVPIIALTANAIMGSEKMFLENGFQAFISKPIEIGHLDEVIRTWVRDTELEKTMDKVDVHGTTLPNIRGGRDRRIFTDRRSGIDRRSFGKTINGIDMEKGIARFNGDEESFLLALQSFAENTHPLLEKIREFSEDQVSDYTITIHGIKGSCLGICAGIAGNKAELLEKAAKDGNLNYVMANNNAFIATAEKLIGDIEELLEEIAFENPKPRKEKPDRDLLLKLVSACESYDMDGVDSAMDEIGSCEYNSDDGLATWLKENVEQMNFIQIVEKLSSLM